MRAGVTGFGRIWRRRFGKNPDDPMRFVRAAYYNTAGILVNGQIRQRPRIEGYARFNGIGGFSPNHPLRMIHRVFECQEPCVWRGHNQLLFERLLPRHERPEAFLVTVQSEMVGRLQIGNNGWKSDDIWVLAFSEAGEQQEAMLLMHQDSWISTALGMFRLETLSGAPRVARLLLQRPLKAAV